MAPLRTVWLLVLSSTFAAPVAAQSASDVLPPIQDMMSSAEFKRAGLQKLTRNELAALNEWLLEYTLQIAQLLDNQSPAPTTAAPQGQVMESQIDGDFEGWEGETVFKLTNGQIWQQASYSYRYHYAFMPQVIIYPAGSGFKMMVDGVDETIYVTRLK